MARQYDLVVIGTGTAAAVAAFRCRASGWRVAVIDELPFGGTCALRGCDPKKVLVGAAETVDQDHRMRGKGVVGGESRLDWRELIEFKRSFTDPRPRQLEAAFAKSGVDAFHGRARFRGPRTLEAGGETLEARFILIATGAVPVRLGIAGEDQLATSTDFLDLKELPRRLLLVGGGYIASEFSHIAVRAGAQVTVLQQRERLLMQFDPDLVELLTRKSRALGIDVRLGARVTAVEKAADRLRVHFVSAGTASSVEADIVVHAAGRAPDLDALDLAAGEVQHEQRRLRLNEFLQSVSNPAVYAAGDAASTGPPLTPIAAHDGEVVAANMLAGNRERPNYLGTPSIVFTIPPLARVGLLEEEARGRNLRFHTNYEQTSDWYTARRVGEECAGFKVLVEEETGSILGAHLLGPNAEEVINIFGLAIRHKLSAAQLKASMFGYPTATSDVGYML